MELETEIQQDISSSPRKGDKVDVLLSYTAHALMFTLMFLPQFAYAQDASGTFSGITAFLRSITNLLIYEWGYYIGIITLAIQGYRWKTGRIDLMQLGGWGLGIGLVFFAPNIVSDLKSRSSGSIQ
ncbi:TrbC/VirB2 family protein [Xylella fastidiosa]|uniref:TrbC/VirB2 family protein n=1 Tax=Xylella fastidiosa TaxID=2371 RepID=UPI000FFE4F62|nr:TrbC/VirB2 family protein [Xylella fastidiosa]RWA37002.1 type VI secretion protein [Xylella fastidiosa subsp. multiplex]